LSSRIRLSDAQRLDWLRLIRAEGVGPRTFRGLINRFGGAAAAIDALPDLAKGRGKIVTVPSRDEAEQEIAAAARIGARFAALGEADYPQALAAIDDAPPLLCVRGPGEILRRVAVAIVGSRNASALGLKFAERIAREMGGAGLVIVSGLARGIDARAHAASLDTGTVAVLAGGQDRIYPAENIPLLDRIVAAGGAIVSEMPIGWEPRGRDFPRRNRLISGIALGTVVVEASRRSGSLITARFAAEQGREVFAAPGSPLDPRAEGTNDLLREGATLMTEAAHVLEALEPLIRDGNPRPKLLSARESEATRQMELWDEIDLLEDGSGASRVVVPDAWAHTLLSEDENDSRGLSPRDAVLAAIGAAPVGVDDVVRATGLDAGRVQREVLELELAGEVFRAGGGLLSRHLVA
jgi:DNA processing protein